MRSNSRDVMLFGQCAHAAVGDRRPEFWRVHSTRDAASLKSIWPSRRLSAGETPTTLVTRTGSRRSLCEMASLRIGGTNTGKQYTPVLRAGLKPGPHGSARTSVVSIGCWSYIFSRRAPAIDFCQLSHHDYFQHSLENCHGKICSWVDSGHTGHRAGGGLYLFSLIHEAAQTRACLTR